MAVWRRPARRPRAHVQLAQRRFANAVLGKKPRLPADGFDLFTPPESAYDPDRARANIYGKKPQRLPQPVEPAEVPSDSERAAWSFPALDWLDTLLGNSRQLRAALIWQPVHVASQPTPGTLGAAREAECKARVARIAARRGTPIFDFRIWSGITLTDSNYWDSLHYRVGVAERVQRGIGEAIKTGRDGPSGEWRLTLPPSTVGGALQ